MRILLLTSHLPYPMNLTGGGQRTALLMQALAACGSLDIVVQCPEESIFYKRLATGEFPVGPWRYLGCTERSLPEPVAPRLWRLLHRRVRAVWDEFNQPLGGLRENPTARRQLLELVDIDAYDAIVVRHVCPAAVARVWKSHGNRLIVDMDDLDWRKVESRAESLRGRSWIKNAIVNLLATVAISRLNTRTRRILRRAGGCWVANPHDLRFTHCKLAGILPNIPFPRETDDRIACPRHPEHILFVGTLNYEPNVEGLQRFLKQVWPRIRAKVHNARLRIVGRCNDSAFAATCQAVPGVDWVGEVDDLAAEYAACSFTVAPVYWGSGTKIKVLESYAFGRSCVGAPHAYHGYEGEFGDMLLEVQSTDDLDFAEKCCRLLVEPGDRDRLAATGKNAIDTHFTREVFNRRVKELVGKIVGGGS